MGGYNIIDGTGTQTYSKQYNSLAPHNQINLSFDVYPIDSWDNLVAADNDHFRVDIDGTNFIGWKVVAYQGAHSVERCGNPIYPEYPAFKVYITMPHILSSVTLKIISVLNEGSENESLGFRNITMNIGYADTPAQSICASSPAPLLDKVCPCTAPHQYQNPALSGTCSNCHSTCDTCKGGTASDCMTCYAGSKTYFKANQCLPCHANCQTCFGGGSNQCLTCISGYFMNNQTHECYPECNAPLVSNSVGGVNYCEPPCSGNYTYWDSYCSSSCPYPLTPNTTNGFGVCVYPCTSSEFLLWNGTCVESCPYPSNITQIRSRNLCGFPCAAEQFIDWEGECRDSCDFPLVKSFHGSPMEKAFCEYPCQQNQFLYFNGSCLSNCASPLSADIIDGKQFCNYQCQMTEFLYWNGSCEASCSFPLSRRVESSRSYCDFPCTNALQALFWNGTCGFCNPPLVLKVVAGNNFCEFGCPAGQYRYWDSTCQASCNFPLREKSEGVYELRYFCEYPCQSTEFLYWNGSCSSSCPYPLQDSTSNSRKFCSFPCSSNQYLFWNGSCLSTCDFPHSIRLEGNPARSYCEYPCTNPLDSLFWNGTCSRCNLPFEKKTIAGKSYCEFPCNANEYLYWDGTCNTTCVAPLVEGAEGYPMLRYFCRYACENYEFLYWNATCSHKCDYPLVQSSESNVNFCSYPCATNEYLYYNRTCELSCNFPLVAKTEASLNYCDYPCTNSQYLAWNGSCFNTCSSPMITRTYGSKTFCYTPCQDPSHFYMIESSTCNQTCNYPYISNNEEAYLRCFSPEPLDIRESLFEAPKNPGQVTIVVLVKSMQYMKYLNSYLPPRLRRFATSRGRNILHAHFGFQLSDEKQVNFAKARPEEIYARNYLQSSFLVNYWNDFTTIGICILIALFLVFLEKVCHRLHFETTGLIIQRLRAIAKWNYVVMLFAFDIDAIILYAALEFKAINKPSVAAESAPLSFAFCVMTLAIMSGFIYFIYHTIAQQDLHQHIPISTDEKVSTQRSKSEDYQIFYKGFKTDNIFKKYFYLIYIGRIGLPMFIAVCADNTPLLVCAMQILISLAILGLLTMKNPFIKKINLIQLLITESIVLLMNLCTTLLTIYHEGDATHQDTVPLLIDLIYLGNDFINILVIVFLAIKICLESFAIIKSMNEQGIKGTRKYIALIQLVSLPLQQGNMGFEEMITYEPYNHDHLKVSSIIPLNQVPNKITKETFNHKRNKFNDSFGTPNYNEIDVTAKSSILIDDLTANSMILPRAHHTVETEAFVDPNGTQRNSDNSTNFEGSYAKRLSSYRKFRSISNNEQIESSPTSENKMSIRRLRDKIEERKLTKAQKSPKKSDHNYE